jgi:hypothetical protein
LHYDRDKYLHVVLLHDHLEWLDEHGLSDPLTYPESMRASLEDYLQNVAEQTRALPDCSQGMTMIVIGGLGRGFMLGFKRWRRTDWVLSVISLPDLLMLSKDVSSPTKRYLKCMSQKAWAQRQGVVFQIPNGDFNFYSYWRQTNHQLIPRELSVGQGSMIAIGPEFVFSTRERIRPLVDLHAVQTQAGPFAKVMRFGLDVYFTSMQRRRIYGSLSHIAAGTLAGVVESSRGASWFTAITRRGAQREQHLAYELWSGFLGLYDTLVSEVEAAIPHMSSGVVEIRLDIRDVHIPESDTVGDMASGTRDPELFVDVNQRVATIRCPPSFLANFQQAENTGERLTVRAMAKGLATLHLGTTVDVPDGWVDAITNKVVGSDVRVLHLFATRDAAEHLLSAAQRGHEDLSLAHEDFVFAKLRLVDGCTSARPGTTLRSKDDCNAFLHQVVAKLWQRLRELLRQFNRTDTLRQLLSVHEAIIHDRDQWQRTAKAVIALHASSEDVFAVAQSREADRNNVALPARTLIEMALCESPHGGGRPLSEWDRDRLVATAALLLEVATDSDAIHSDLIEPLWVNGEYTLDRAFYERVIQPFVAGYFREGFLRAADAYAKLYRDESNPSRRRLDDLFSSDFIAAFTAEFGLTLDEAVEGFGGLLDIAIERESVIVETTVGEVRQHIIAHGLSGDACASFIKAFSLFHRPKWDEIPAGFSWKDLWPWRYSRRLSVTVRPLIAFGENDDATVLYGVGTLRQGFGHLIDRTEGGQMPSDFFESEEMKAYLGAVSHERGHAFAESVAESARKDGWQARTAVKMTELGAPAELGDFDVLAWKSDGSVELVECKRLQLARTVAEIAEICRRFRGEAKDELAKHMRRVRWIKENPSGLSRIVGAPVTRDRIDIRVVTNTHVPMRYLESLPIQADKIGPLSRLVDQ